MTDFEGLEITTLLEKARGCGYRKGGGLYIMQGEFRFRDCGRLPLVLNVCPTCHAGIKPARGWTWINPAALFGEVPCQSPHLCTFECMLNTLPERAGLIWIGEKFYPTPADYLREAREQGISRRLHSIPKDFTPGETIVLLAHRKAIPGIADGDDAIPAIFTAFRPTHVEYVVKDDDDPKKLERMAERGIKLVRIQPIDEHGNPVTPDGDTDDENGLDLENGQ